MPAEEFRDVPVEMLGADVVVGAAVSALEHRSEGLHPVRVRIASDVFAGRVIDALALEPGTERVVGRGFIGVNGRSSLRLLGHEVCGARRARHRGSTLLLKSGQICLVVV